MDTLLSPFLISFSLYLYQIIDIMKIAIKSIALIDEQKGFSSRLKVHLKVKMQTVEMIQQVRGHYQSEDITHKHAM